MQGNAGVWLPWLGWETSTAGHSVVDELAQVRANSAHSYNPSLKCLTSMWHTLGP